MNNITETPQNYNKLLIKLASINAITVILMTIAAFFIFIGYHTNLWNIVSKWDIFKVFFQNFRFNLSVICYINIPILIALALLLGFKTLQIPKLFVNTVKMYYLSLFTLFFSMQISSYMFRSVFAKNNIPSSDFFAQLITLYSQFNNQMFFITIAMMSFIFISAVIFFIIFLKVVLTTQEYEVSDPQKAITVTIIALLLCIFFAKGKLIGHLSEADSVVTPVVELNQLAVNGPYKIICDLKKFDVTNIKYRGDELSSDLNDFNLSEEEKEKVKEYEKNLMYQFNPQQQ
jgi:hypothetical protein